ncbi:MAG TPA: S8 family peptidase [bacterium]|nr:S8 family peptidase [bacterium]
MRSIGVRVFAALALCFYAVVPSVEAVILDHAHVPGEMIVVFTRAATPQQQASLNAAMGARSTQDLGIAHAWLMKFDPAASLADLQSGYEASPWVEAAEPNYWGEGGFIPNDTFYANQWHHNNTGQFGGTPGADIESQAGWDDSRGSASVTVAVLDSGIDSDHPEFAGRIVAGFDCVNEDANPEDDNGHGTLVTGLLAANANNGFAVAGVDHFCRIMPVKVLNAGNSGTVADLIQGIGIASAASADVFNMSLINYPVGPALQDALRHAKEAGAILMACAGNGGIGDADVSGPGASPHTISIGVTDNNDVRAFYSGTGDELEFVAPGDNVITLLYNSGVNGTSFFNGCSAATPVASGIVSILRGLEPELRTRHVRDILKAAAEDLVGPPNEDTPGWDEFFGYGRLNLNNVLDGFLAATAAPLTQDGKTQRLGLHVDPNPSSAAAHVVFTVPVRNWIDAQVVDVTGRKIRSLAHGIRLEGEQRLEWDGQDDHGQTASAGIYFVRVRAGDQEEIRKITRLR